MDPKGDTNISQPIFMQRVHFVHGCIRHEMRPIPSAKDHLNCW